MSVEWPKLDELKQLLDADPESTAFDGDTDNTRLTRLLGSAIQLTKDRTGAWVEGTDEPTEMLAQAALRAAHLLAPPVNRSPDSIVTDPIFNALMTGHRRRFGIS